MAQQVASQREEQQFALNATARETISKVKGMLVQQQTTAMAPPSSKPFFGDADVTRGVSRYAMALPGSVLAPATPTAKKPLALGGNAQSVVCTPSKRHASLYPRLCNPHPKAVTFVDATPIEGMVAPTCAPLMCVNSSPLLEWYAPDK